MSKQTDAEKFVRLWMEARSNGGINWLIKETRTSRQALEHRATRLRSWGVHLPRLNNKITNPYDADKLNLLIQQLDNEHRISL